MLSQSGKKQLSIGKREETHLRQSVKEVPERKRVKSEPVWEEIKRPIIHGCLALVGLEKASLQSCFHFFRIRKGLFELSPTCLFSIVQPFICREKRGGGSSLIQFKGQRWESCTWIRAEWNGADTISSPSLQVELLLIQLPLSQWAHLSLSPCKSCSKTFLSLTCHFPFSSLLPLHLTHLKWVGVENQARSLLAVWCFIYLPWDIYLRSRGGLWEEAGQEKKNKGFVWGQNLILDTHASHECNA